MGMILASRFSKVSKYGTFGSTLDPGCSTHQYTERAMPRTQSNEARLRTKFDCLTHSREVLPMISRLRIETDIDMKSSEHGTPKNIAPGARRNVWRTAYSMPGLAVLQA